MIETLDPPPVQILDRPFTTEHRELARPHGLTIAELLQLAGIPPGTPVRVFVNGDLVYPEYYRVVRPKRGAHVLVRVVPRGGGGGQGKNIGTLIAGILLIVVGFAISDTWAGFASPYLISFGVSLVLQKYALWQWGPSVRQISEPVHGDFNLFYLQYPWYRIVTALLAGLIITALWLFLKYGKYGIWIRATTQDRVMAQAMGIPVPLVYTAVFAIGSGMAAASGVLFGPFAGVTQTMGFDFTLRAFIVVVVGGMGNLGGSILASIFVSLLESYAAIMVSPAQAVIVSFVVLVLTMLFRPTGLFVPTPK